MSLYADYILERTDDLIIEIPEGFATYRFLNEKQCYIIDIFVSKEHRRSKIATQLANQIVKKAKDKGCTELIGTVYPCAKNSTSSLKALLAYDMVLDKSEKDVIIMKKGI